MACHSTKGDFAGSIHVIYKCAQNSIYNQPLIKEYVVHVNECLPILGESRPQRHAEIKSLYRY